MLTVRAVYDSQLQRVCVENLETHVPIFFFYFFEAVKLPELQPVEGLMHILLHAHLQITDLT